MARQRTAHGTIRRAACLALLVGAAGCSDDFARVGGGLTTASLGLEGPSNQDRIIRKAGTAQAKVNRQGIRPVDAPQQSYPGDVAPVAQAATYAAPSVTSARLAPLTPSEPAAAVAVPLSRAAKTVQAAKPAVAPVTARAAKVVPVAGRRVTKPKLAAAGVPVIPPSPKAPGKLRKLGDDITTGSVKAAKARAVVRKAVDAPGGGYTVVSGDTVYGIARRYGVSSDAVLAANGMDNANLSIGQRLVIPGRSVSAPAPVQVRKVTPSAVKSDAVILTGSVPPAAAKPVATARPVVPATAAAKPSAKGFAWPARGRILATFGQRTPAGTNDGVDIALPEGSAVQAAADGIVLYSGSELKNFGNLVLVRHDDGWVSAYANASKNLVKRGDRVSRGQTIARSGKTGNATQPQLHFELRRNSKPVDPQRHLDG